MELEEEWTQYPVIHLDLSVCKSQEDAKGLRHALSLLIEPYERIYGANPSEQTPGQKLKGVIQRAYEKTGHQASTSTRCT